MNFQLFSLTLIMLISFYIVLSFNVIRFRRQNRLPTGDNNEIKFRNAIRSHANCGEYLPLLLLELYILTQLDVNVFLFGALCLAAICGRFIHAYGLNFHETRVPAVFTGRQVGMVLTFACLIVSGVAIFFYGCC